jgi:hypothetical protein
MKLTKQHLREIIREELKRSKLLKENEMSELPSWEDALAVFYAVVEEDGDRDDSTGTNIFVDPWPAVEKLASQLREAGQDPDMMLQYLGDAVAGYAAQDAEEDVDDIGSQDPEEYVNDALAELEEMYKALGKYTQGED